MNEVWGSNSEREREQRRKGKIAESSAWKEKKEVKGILR
jgi:hypothetical protein